MASITFADDADIYLVTEKKLPGFDGHSLRAYSYFSERMLDIEQAPDGARCFEAQIGDTRIWFHEYEMVTYLDREMTGAELWERLSNVRVTA